MNQSANEIPPELAEALQRNRRGLEQLVGLGQADLYRRYQELVATQEQLTWPAAEQAKQPAYLAAKHASTPSWPPT